MSGRYGLKDDPYSSHAVILSRLGEGRGRRCLDVGAADGFLASRLRESGWRVTALEGDTELAADARAAGHTVVVADLNAPLPSLGGPFDAIVCGDVLEHLRDPLGVLRRLIPRLVPAGQVIVSVPNVAHLWVRLSLLAGRFEYSDRGILDRTHLRFFTRRTLLDLLEGAGLVVERVVSTPVPLALVVPERMHGRWLDTLHAMSAAASRSWPGGLAYQFVALCRLSPTALTLSDAADRPETLGAAAGAGVSARAGAARRGVGPVGAVARTRTSA